MFRQIFILLAARNLIKLENQKKFPKKGKIE